MPEILKYIPQIIEKAAKSYLGLFALIIIALSLLGYFFFCDASVMVKVVIYTLLFAGAVAFGIAVFRAHGKDQGDTQKSNSVRPLVRHLMLFLIKSKLKLGGVECPRILTYMSYVWESYLLVNTGYDPNTRMEDQRSGLISKLSARIGVNPQDLSVTHVREHDFENTKYSYGEHTEVTYKYKFCHVIISNVKSYPYLLNEEFTFGGNNYRWMTLAEMKSDTYKTYERNRDVIRTLTMDFDDLLEVPESF